MTIATLSTKNQSVVPADIRKALDLKPGDTIEYHLEGNHAVIRKAEKNWKEQLESSKLEKTTNYSAELLAARDSEWK